MGPNREAQAQASDLIGNVELRHAAVPDAVARLSRAFDLVIQAASRQKVGSVDREVGPEIDDDGPSEPEH